MQISNLNLKLEIPSFVNSKIQFPEFVQKSNPFGKYKIVKQLGKGAFGSVVEIKTSEGTSKAIKILDVSKRSESCLIKKALKEATISMSIKHSNIIKMYEVFYDGYNFFFVMDLISPISISRLPDSRRDQIILFKQLVSAVAHLHSNNILHRDIKIENTGIRLGEDEELKLYLFDFGEAVPISEHYHECAGTVLNMSPEVVKYCKYSESSEVWALMCYLIELITGKSMILELFDGLHGSIEPIHIQLKINSLVEPPIPAFFKVDESPFGLLILQILERGLVIKPEERLTFSELECLLQELVTYL